MANMRLICAAHPSPRAQRRDAKYYATNAHSGVKLPSPSLRSVSALPAFSRGYFKSSSATRFRLRWGEYEAQEPQPNQQSQVPIVGAHPQHRP